MVAISVDYKGNFKCVSTHGPSGTALATDAPADNGGGAESFSPTDLVATALLTCIMTTMAIYARRHGLELDGMKGRAEKVMAASPRRIGAIEMAIEMPVAENHPLGAGLKAAALGCPVHHTLHPETRMHIEWTWRDC